MCSSFEKLFHNSDQDMTVEPVIPRPGRSPMEVVLSPTPLQRSYRKIIGKALLIAMETIYVNGNRRLVS